MKKTISGVLLALAATFALVACGKKKTTTAKGGETTKAKTTEKKTTKEHKRRGQANVINFYCWNSEFQERLNGFYSKKTGVDGGKTNLEGGNTIIWIATPNQGSAYQDALDLGLENDMVDMYTFEADFATKYVKSEYALDMATFSSLNQSKQYRYTKDIVTNGEGKIVGSSWQATPGVILYNTNVAKDVWGEDYTEATVAAALSTNFDTFKAAVKKVSDYTKTKTADADKRYALTGTADLYRVYSQNIKTKMFDGEKITIAKDLFQWAKDTMDFKALNAFHGVADTYGLWGDDWKLQQGKDQDLCIFSCPWFTDFCLTGNRAPVYADHPTAAEGYQTAAERQAKGYTYAEDSELRCVKSYKGWFWGGTWLTATPVSQQESTIKDVVGDIIKEMTTDKTVLEGISRKHADFTNDTEAMQALADDDTFTNGYFGGQHVFKIYAESVASADLSGASDYDQQINENMQSAFSKWFQGTKTAKEAWELFVKDVETKTSKKVYAAEGVTITADGITIA